MWSSPSRVAWRWSAPFRGSVTHQLIKRAGDISIHVIAEQREPRTAGARAGRRRGNRAEPGADRHRALCGQPRHGCRGARHSGSGLQQFLGISNIALVFLTAVLASAVTYGLWPSLFACLASVLAYNFFFLPPLYTFTIADPENVVALFVFAVVAVIASNLTARVRAQAFAARQRAKTTEELYLFSRKLAGAVDLDDLLWATAYQIALMLKVRVVLLAAGRREHCGAGRLSAGGHSGRGRSRGGEMGLAEQSSRRVAARTPCPARSACFCRCVPGAARLGWSGSTATARARC